MITLDLPWPAKELSPNFRGHWTRVHLARRHYRVTAAVLCRAAMGAQCIHIGESELKLRYEFFPPQARAYDRDNLAARMKAATDGVADAFKVNDRGFHFAPAVLREKVAGGLVRLTIEVMEEGAC